VLAWRRRDGEGREVILVSNFTPLPRPGYRLPVAAGLWKERLNTDSSHYGGSNLGNLDGTLQVEEGCLSLTLPPLATLFLIPHSS
jgi:1,4-alpha-glucan branching enzyme